MDRLFNESFTRPGGRGRGDTVDTESEGYLPMDVYRTDSEWVVRAAVPGADPNSVEVTCEGNTVRISGEIQWPKDVKSEDFWLRENFYGQFRRQFMCRATSLERNPSGSRSPAARLPEAKGAAQATGSWRHRQAPGNRATPP
jgi:HSP20 family protein